MERTEILVNIRSTCDTTDNTSTVQPSMITIPPGDPYSIESDGQSNSYFSIFNDLCSGVTAHTYCLALEQFNKNSSSSSNKEYQQSDYGDHDSDLEE
eukprot:10511953-Ditylum_brightwellii.AAC.1